MGDESKINPRWLRLRDAASYSAIGLHRLKSLARNGTINGFPDPDSGRGDWIFDRLSIDAYRESQSGADIRKAILARVMHGIGKTR